MFGFDDPEAFWLNVTNVALGVVTIICLCAVCMSVVKELRERSRKRAVATADDHATFVPGLGLTMADGGEKIEDTSKTFVSPNGSIRDANRPAGEKIRRRKSMDRQN